MIYNYIAVPKHIQDLHSEVVLYRDVFFFNIIPFIITLSPLTTTEWIVNREINTNINLYDTYSRDSTG